MWRERTFAWFLGRKKVARTCRTRWQMCAHIAMTASDVMSVAKRVIRMNDTAWTVGQASWCNWILCWWAPKNEYVWFSFFVAVCHLNIAMRCKNRNLSFKFWPSMWLLSYRECVYAGKKWNRRRLRVEVFRLGWYTHSNKFTMKLIGKNLRLCSMVRHGRCWYWTSTWKPVNHLTFAL